MFRFLLKAFFTVFAGLFFVSSSLAFGNKNFNSVNDILTGVSADKQKNNDGLNIIAKINKAKRILENQKVNYKICGYKKRIWIKKGKRRVKKFFTIKHLCEKEFLLAVSHKDKNEIEIVRFKNEQTDNENFWIEMGRPNGIATSFSVKHPPDYTVLAIKTTLKKINPVRTAVYTPYSKELNSYEVRQEGLNYLNKILQNAAQRINNGSIQSRLTGEKLIITDEWIKIAKTLSINEHIDPLEYIKKSDGNENDENTSSLTELIEKVLIILGANHDIAYKYSVSSAQARNLFQHIPSTYKYASNNCVGANLKPNFVEGMNDHENAARATFCLFNVDIYILKTFNINVEQNPENLRKFIASSYNCGAERTAKLIKKYGENWTNFLPIETEIYLKKFDFIWSFLSSIEDSGD